MIQYLENDKGQGNTMVDLPHHFKEPSMKKMRYVFVGIIFCYTLLFVVPWANALENGECMECHGDSSLVRTNSQGLNDSLFVEQKLFQYSVHNINGIQCVDCHADITELTMDQDVPHGLALGSVNCAGCHEEVAIEYAKGVHQQASSKGLTIQCYACHGYHDVVSSVNLPVLERENKSCLKCHEPTKFHNWLPQKDTHFTFVQCTACHAPDTPHVIHLRFYNLAKKEFLQPEEVLSALGTDFDGFLAKFDNDGKTDELNAEEFDNMVFALNRRGVRASFHAELLSVREPKIHQITKVAAKRACEDCHAPDSKFFESVALFFVDREGVAHQYAVDRKVLESHSVNNFYVPGGGRMRQLDMFGILAVVGAVSGISLHLFGRVVTAPLRKKRHGDATHGDKV